MCYFSSHKDAQNALLTEINKKITSLQETISSNYANLNDHFKTIQDKKFFTDKTLKFFTDELNIINNLYIDAR